MRIILVTILAMVMLFRNSTTSAQRTWAHERSALPRDPRVQIGHLENGFTYGWIHNDQLPNVCSLRLIFFVGSLHEEDDEQGIAHYLEHMAFKGGKVFPPGSLLKWFEARGIRFGADLNATTNFDVTTYVIDLPDCSSKELDQALTVFRDIADGLLLRQEDIDAERGVIDQEERDRSTPGFNMLLWNLENLYKGTRFRERLPIGRKPIRDEFSKDRENFARFYRKWYRPDNMALVIVGDLPKKNLYNQIETHFRSMTLPAEPLPTMPPLGELLPVRDDKLVSIPGYPGRAIYFGVPRDDLKPKTFTEKWAIDQAITSTSESLYAMAINQHRGKDFLDSMSFSTSKLHENYGYQYLKIIAPSGVALTKTAGHAGSLHRSLLEQGIQSQNFQEYLKFLATALDRASKQSDAQNDLTNLLDDALGIQPIASDQFNHILKDRIAEQSPETFTKMIRKRWSSEVLAEMPMLVIDQQRPSDPEKYLKEIRRAFFEGLDSGEIICMQQEVLRFEHRCQRNSSTTYTKKKIPDLAATQVTLKSNVTGTFKSMHDPTNNNLVFVSLHLRRGLLPKDERVLAEVGSRALAIGGTEKHPPKDLPTIISSETAGRPFGVSQDIGKAHVGLSGVASTEDMRFLFEMLRAFITQPGLREDTTKLALNQIVEAVRNSRHEISYPVAHQFFPKMLVGWPAPLRVEELESLTTPAITSWVRDQLLSYCPQLTIIGDFDLDKVINEFNDVFSGLSCTTQPYEQPIIQFKSGIHQRAEVASGGVQDVLLAVWHPILDSSSYVFGRVLAIVLTERLRNILRVEKGWAYSPSFNLLNLYQGQHLLAEVSVDPKNSKQALAEIVGVMTSLKTSPVSSEELQRAKAQLLAAQKTEVQRAPVWLEKLSSTYGAKEFAQLSDDVNSLTLEAVQDYVAKHVDPNEYSSIIVSQKK